MNSIFDQEGLPESVTDEELVAAVAGAFPEIERTAGLKELLRRQAPVVGQLLADVIVDPAAPLELRTTAARALGKERVAKAATVLLAALDSDQPALVARVAESLGRIGGRKALDALAQVEVAPGSGHGRTIQFARTLISYRLGLDAERLQPPAAADVLDLDRRRAIALRVETVEPRDFRAAKSYLRRELPKIAVAERGSVRFSCRQERLWFVLAKEVAGTAAGKRIADRSAVVAVVLKESTCPDAWYVYEYFLSHPRDARKVEVFGVRPTGDLSHFGEIELHAANAAVRLRTVNTPRLPAIDFEAEYRGREGTFSIKDLFVATVPQDEQKRPLNPRADTLRLQ